MLTQILLSRLQRRQAEEMEGEERGPGGAVPCLAGGGDCECSSCLVSLALTNKLLFYRKYSDPAPRGLEERPRYWILCKELRV